MKIAKRILALLPLLTVLLLLCISTVRNKPIIEAAENFTVAFCKKNFNDYKKYAHPNLVANRSEEDFHGSSFYVSKCSVTKVEFTDFNGLTLLQQIHMEHNGINEKQFAKAHLKLRYYNSFGIVDTEIDIILCKHNGSWVVAY